MKSKISIVVWRALNINKLKSKQCSQPSLQELYNSQNPRKG